MYYELVKAFNDVQLPFGVAWFDNDGEYLGEEYFATEELRQEAIDRWYANEEDIFTHEQ